jgi:Protein of unknown function (DUF5674)
MKIHLLRERATPQQVSAMLEALETFIKLAVDIERSVVDGGGEMRADSEAVLLKDGSRQEDIWGADWDPHQREVRFEALINIRPRQGNRSMMIQNPEIRSRVEAIVRWVFEETDDQV